MPLEPLKQWICDSCGGVITKPREGWWEYKDNLKTKEVLEFRIVHYQPECMYNDQALDKEGLGVGDMHLAHMITSGSFGHFLDWFEKSAAGKIEEKIDIPAFFEMLRRLYLPYWEEARQYWDQALKEGFHDGTDFSDGQLQSIIAKYAD